MNLSDPRFTDVTAARTWLESQRWADGWVCPHCGNADQAKIRALAGKSHRPGVYQCNECREQFTVTVGTVMERSKIPLNKWVMAMHLMSASKKGMSAHQLHRMLGVTYKTAWFLAHRIREAMRPGPGAGPIGGEGKIVEADETYFGKTEEARPSPKRKGLPYTKGGRSGPSNKLAIVSLVERGGSVRSFHPGVADKVAVTAIVKENIAKESKFFTDESRLYTGLSAHFVEHSTVKHSVGEYVRGEVHSNTIEGYFSIFKRGMKGIYQHCAEKHLHRYLAEFDFRYKHRTKLGFSDYERTCQLAQGLAGKRLTYRRIDEAGRHLHG
ncbi:IS1595 family transposase [Methylobacterium sp. 37f]|uniref:IS1595 family transposase n=1 Tax=Methylobacterium sp. 37f TaxID=2817058 RepID=UPI001FFD0F7D|nr:IS1595 family transposase [Methylobacterium sp. 37f]MCK2057120.1 IS1595 family transposase [Methylobacterium sp. 37f]